MKKSIDMTSGSPLRHIILFAFPMLIGSVFQQLYSFADAAIVGHWVGSNALAAVGTTGSLSTFLIAVANGLTTGAGIIISQCFGAESYGEMKKSVSAMAWALLFIGAAVTIIGTALARPILRLLQVPDLIIDDSCAYIRVIFGSSLAVIAYNACSSVLRSLGNSKTPLYMLIISCVTNIVLDLLFVVGLNMGVIGAALATALSTVLSAVLCLIYIAVNRKSLMLDNIPRMPEKYMLVKIFKIGLPTAFQSCMISLGGMSVQGLVNSFGTVAIAAYTASTKVDSIAIQVVVSIAMALSVFSGQNMGAGRIDRMRKGLHQTLAVMIPICVFIAAVMLVFKRSILSLLLNPVEGAGSIDIGCTYLSIIGVGYVIAGIMQSFMGLIRGAGDVNTSVAAGLAELSMRVAASYLFVNFWGLTGVWIAVPVSWACGCSIPIIRYFSGKWLKKGLVASKGTEKIHA